MDIYEELKQLIKALNQKKVQYALCGGLALAVHGIPRATVDIDIIIEEKVLPKVREIADRLGFSHSPGKMEFKAGAVKIIRLVKFDKESGDELPLDLMIVTPEIAGIWRTREKKAMEWGEFSVVSRDGLIELKELRGSGTDRDDIRRLRGEANGD